MADEILYIPVPHCCVCLNTNNTALVPYTTVVGGYLVCSDHAKVAEGDHGGKVLDLIESIKKNRKRDAT